mmetsp:Transcript_61687/g.141217  ORF Transcript_61687/g.141217 Transcript_61687/m.141217 type:complete len:470 (-) Transcript_61687:1015-2424(-)
MCRRHDRRRELLVRGGGGGVLGRGERLVQAPEREHRRTRGQHPRGRGGAQRNEVGRFRTAHASASERQLCVEDRPLVEHARGTAQGGLGRGGGGGGRLEGGRCCGGGRGRGVHGDRTPDDLASRELAFGGGKGLEDGLIEAGCEEHPQPPRPHRNVGQDVGGVGRDDGHHPLRDLLLPCDRGRDQDRRLREDRLLDILDVGDHDLARGPFLRPRRHNLPRGHVPKRAENGAGFRKDERGRRRAASTQHLLGEESDTPRLGRLVRVLVPDSGAHDLRGRLQLRMHPLHQPTHRTLETLNDGDPPQPPALAPRRDIAPKLINECGPVPQALNKLPRLLRLRGVRGCRALRRLVLVSASGAGRGGGGAEAEGVRERLDCQEQRCRHTPFGEGREGAFDQQPRVRLEREVQVEEVARPPGVAGVGLEGCAHHLSGLEGGAERRDKLLGGRVRVRLDTDGGDDERGALAVKKVL